MTVTTAPSLCVFVTDENRQALDKDGYFVTDVVFDEATLAGVRAEFVRIWEENIKAVQGADELAREQARHRPFLAQLHLKSAACDAFCRHRVFRDLSLQLVGPDIDMTWNQAILKPPSVREPGASDTAANNAFAWHQDPWYALKGDYAKDSNMEMLQAPNNSITCWAAISRTTVDNGTLWVLPGRHKEGLFEHKWCAKRREWNGQFDTAYKVPVVMRAGQVLVLRKYLPHGSGANITADETRMAYQIGYCGPGLKLGPSRDLEPIMRDGKPLK